MGTIKSYQGDAFVGISHLFFIQGGFYDDFAVGSGTSGSTPAKVVNEVPVAQDGGFTYNGGTPTIQHYKIHGLVGDWTSRMTPGDTEINLFIPVVNKEVLEACGFTVKNNVTPGVVQDTDDNVKFTSTGGFAFAETQKAFSVGLAAINDEGNKMFAIKKVKLLASILFDSADTAKPIGITLVGSSAASTAEDAMGIFDGETGVAA